MDLPASCGSRRSGPAGLEPATRCRSKHQVRRVASGAGTLHRQNRQRGRQSKSARQAGKRFSSGSQAGDSRREDSDSQPQPTNPPTPSLGRPTQLSLLFDRWEGSVSRHYDLIGQACRAISRPSKIGRGGSAHVFTPRPGSRAAICCVGSPLAERRQTCTHPSDWLRGAPCPYLE